MQHVSEARCSYNDFCCISAVLENIYAWDDESTYLQITQHLQELLLSSLRCRRKGGLGIQHSGGLVVDLCSRNMSVRGVQHSIGCCLIKVDRTVYTILRQFNVHSMLPGSL
jgi:hypothetical protein